MYETFVRRTVVETLEGERRAQIRAIISNGGYFQSEELLKSRGEEIERLNEHFDKVVSHVRDPGRKAREEKAFRENALFSAGMRGLDRLKWDLGASSDAQAALKSQGF